MLGNLDQEKWEDFLNTIQLDNVHELKSRLLIFIFLNFIQIGLRLMNDDSLNVLIIGISA